MLTYGVRSSSPFVEGESPSEFKEWRDEQQTFYCTDVFTTFVTKNQVLKISDPPIERSFTPGTSSQTAVSFKIFATAQAGAITYCSQIKDTPKALGEVIVDINQAELRRVGREIYSLAVHMSFSGGNIVVTATDKQTGKAATTTVTFYGQ